MSRFEHDLGSEPSLPQRAAPARPCSAPRASLAGIRGVVVGLLVVCAAASALGAGKEVSVSERVDVAAPPAKTWNTIKDFDGWQEWHPAFARTEITQGLGNTQGTVRVLTARDGARFTEELVSFSATSRTYRYRIIESPAPISDYVSTLQVKPHKDGSTVVWSSHFKVNPGTPDADAKKAISGIYRVGLDHLATVLN